MSVSSIAPKLTVFSLPSSNSLPSLDQSSKEITPSNDRLSSQTTESSFAVMDGDSVISSAAPKTSDAKVESHGKQARSMSHIMEVYNSQGKKRVQFLDSHNNIIYQIPPEMVAKTEDLMMKSSQSSDIKG